MNFLTIEQIQDQILVELELLEKLEKYEYLIDLAQILPPMESIDKLPINKINNCQSRTWIAKLPELSDRLFFTGSSDSQLVSGLIAILWRIYNGQNCTDILQTQLVLPEKMGLSELLTSGRQTGFWQIESKIKSLAQEKLASI